MSEVAGLDSSDEDPEPLYELGDGGTHFDVSEVDGRLQECSKTINWGLCVCIYISSHSHKNLHLTFF